MKKLLSTEFAVTYTDSEHTGISLISRTTEKTSESTFNNSSKYIFSKLDIEKTPADIISILEEFPEYYQMDSGSLIYSLAILTNIGLLAFWKEGTTEIVVYDIYGNDESTTLYNIIPDFNQISKYNYINNPLNYRRLYISGQYFEKEIIAISGDINYSRLNCDKISLNNSTEVVAPNEKGYFELSSDDQISTIYFEFKPQFLIKTNSSLKYSLFKNGEDIIALSDIPSTGYIDFTNEPIYNSTEYFLKIKINDSNLVNSYLEVL